MKVPKEEARLWKACGGDAKLGAILCSKAITAIKSGLTELEFIAMEYPQYPARMAYRLEARDHIRQLRKQTMI